MGVDGRLVAVVQQGSDVGVKEEMAELFELDTIRQEQSKESEIDQVIKAIQQNSTMDKAGHNSDLERAYSKGRLPLSADGILRFVNFRGRATRNHPLGVIQELVVLPKSLRRRLLFLVHDSLLSGHMGQARTWERACRAAWWPGMKKDVMTYIQGCDKCQSHKRKKFPGKAPLRNTDIPRRPFGQGSNRLLRPFSQVNSRWNGVHIGYPRRSQQILYFDTNKRL